MNFLPKFLLLILSLTASAMFADAYSQPLQASYSIVELDYSTENGVSLETIKSSVELKSSVSKVFTESFSTRFLNNNTSTFQALEQTTPIYRLKTNFRNLNQINRINQRHANLFQRINSPPWYIQVFSKSNRLSGWKDGNSLYTGVITYHS